MPPAEDHKSSRVGWLRASVLGANDGILSTASLIVGVAAAGSSRSAVLLAGLAGAVAGALSMAAGEYVSVSSQADAESADLERERDELEANPEGELDELAGIYVERGLDPELARQVATELMEHDALGAHARDELGFSHTMMARPLQAGIASAAAFLVGAALPLLVAVLSTDSVRVWLIAVTSLVFLAMLGAAGAWAGGAPMGKAALRVSAWGAAAMAITAAIGSLFGTSV
jgi:VIT1/CCC1 family predicted Fe2+/Mn2+ transporter